jgi:hypothetical protein
MGGALERHDGAQARNIFDPREREQPPYGGCYEECV